MLGLLEGLCQYGPLDESLLHHAGKTRKKWTSRGDLDDPYNIEDFGMDSVTARLIRDQIGLEVHLLDLESDNLIARTAGMIDICRPRRPCSADEHGASMILICYLFSGCEYTTDFSSIGNAALSLFEHMVEAFRLLDEEKPPLIRDCIVKALLSASKFSDLSFKDWCVSTADELRPQKMPMHTEAYFAVRKAFVLRSRGEWEKAQSHVRQWLAEIAENCSDGRMNAIRGLLVNELTMCLFEREDLDAASEVWRSWEVSKLESGRGSLYESRVAIRILKATGDASVQQGKFEIAERLLNSC